MPPKTNDYTITDLMRIFKRSRSGVYKLLKRQPIPSVTIGKYRYFPRKYFDDLLKQEQEQQEQGDLYQLWYNNFAHIPYELFSYNPSRFINQHEDD